MNDQVQDLFNQATVLDGQAHEMEWRAKVLRDQSNDLKRKAAAIMAEELYGVKIGDLIEYTDRTGRHKLKIDRFKAYRPNDDELQIEGTMLLKSGKVGLRYNIIWHPLSAHIKVIFRAASEPTKEEVKA